MIDITKCHDFFIGIAYGIPSGIVIGLFLMIWIYKRAGVVTPEG